MSSANLIHSVMRWLTSLPESWHREVHRCSHPGRCDRHGGAGAVRRQLRAHVTYAVPGARPAAASFGHGCRPVIAGAHHEPMGTGQCSAYRVRMRFTGVTIVSTSDGAGIPRSG